MLVKVAVLASDKHNVTNKNVKKTVIRPCVLTTVFI